MSYSFQNPSDEVIESYLKSAKTIAIVGLSHRKEAASYQVAHFLQAAGYRIIPVNDFLETDATVFWSQIGLENEEAETILRQANRQDIVMNRCTKREYMRLFV